MTTATPVVERASATDRAFLAMDAGRVPEQFGVVLLLDDAEHLDLARVRELVDIRVPAVPRLRQRLVAAPLGCGGPIWVDDATFDVAHHVREIRCREPGGASELLDLAMALAEDPLPRGRPLWRMVLVTGLMGDRRALVLVLHHVLADGIGGLDVLVNLADPGGRPVAVPFPRPRPDRETLARDALRGRVAGLRDVRRSWHLLRTAMTAGGGVHPTRAAPTSLNRPTSPLRSAGVVQVPWAPLREAAHAHGATTNDAVLVALAAALHRVLVARGELVDSLMVTVPVSGRQGGGEARLGNLVSPLLVEVPTTGDLAERLDLVAGRVRADKEAATGPPPIAVLGWLFRPMARAGLYRWYMTHQHRFHVIASHVRGPRQTLTFGGVPIVSAIPLGAGEPGNATVGFEILSYAGTLTVTAVVDPEHWPDLDLLVDSLRTELDRVAGAGLSRPRERGAP
jgi:WS/DGAT/MGAT family acyltransferase